MNEELQKALAEFVRATLEGFKAGKDFVVAEAPEVIQQLIRWKFWEAVFFAAVWLAAIVVALVVAKRLFSAGKQTDGDPFDFYFTGGMLVACSVMCMVAVISNVSVALQIYIAPKVWLIEWAMGQVRK